VSRRQWVRGNIECAVVAGAASVMEIADCCGPMAVHTYYLDSDYRVTHIPTGMAFPPPARFTQAKSARRFARLLLTKEPAEFWNEKTGIATEPMAIDEWFMRAQAAFFAACRDMAIDSATRPGYTARTEGGSPMAEQTEIKGFEQERIPSIERIAAKFGEKRNLVAGLKDEMKNLAYKLREAMHEHEAQLFQQEDDMGEDVLVYERGDFRVIVKGKESLNVKIKADGKGAEPE
jgi:hypothetical protein